MNRKLIICLFVAALGSIAAGAMLHAQSMSLQLINSNGSSYTGQDVNFSWSMGEISIQTYSSSGSILTEGLLQPEPVIVSGIQEGYLPGDWTVFPNPFSDRIWIRWNNAIPVTHVIIYSLSGQAVYDNNYDGSSIDAGNLKPGVYMLFAYSKDRDKVLSFKILKF